MYIQTGIDTFSMRNDYVICVTFFIMLMIVCSDVAFVLVRVQP